MGICFFLYKSTYDPVKNINQNWINSHKWVESTSSNSSPYGFSNLLKPTIGDKMSWDTSPKTGLFYNLQTSKPIHAMLCRCSSYLQKTTNTPTLKGGDRGGAKILLFSEVTLFEYNVSTILMRLQLTGVCKRRERENKLITTCLFQSIVTGLGSSFSESNSNNLVFPRTWGIEW